MKKYFFNLINQLLRNFKYLLIIGFISTCVMVGVYILSLFTEASTSQLTRDITAIGNIPAYYGIQSQLGLYFWVASITICFFSYKFFYKEMRMFIIASGFISSLLALDDTFLLHEEILPILIGIPEMMVYLFYILILSLYILKFHKLIFKTDYILFFLACSFFGISLILDKVYPVPHIIEDGLKFIGIVSWCMYFYRVTITRLSADKNINL